MSLLDADCQVGVVGHVAAGADDSSGAKLPRGLRTVAFAKAANLGKDRGAHRHVRPYRIAHRGKLFRKAGVAAAEDPVELTGEPAGNRTLPEWEEFAAGARGDGLLDASRELLEPFRLCLRVVVDEGDHFALRHGD